MDSMYARNQASMPVMQQSATFAAWPWAFKGWSVPTTWNVRGFAGSGSQGDGDADDTSSTGSCSGSSSTSTAYSAAANTPSVKAGVGDGTITRPFSVLTSSVSKAKTPDSLCSFEISGSFDGSSDLSGLCNARSCSKDFSADETS